MSTATEPIGTGWAAVLRGPLSGLTWGLVFVTLSVATESLIIATIMPTIVRDIGGIELYGLAFSAFFLTGLVSIPVAGYTALEGRLALAPITESLS